MEGVCYGVTGCLRLMLQSKTRSTLSSENKSRSAGAIVRKHGQWPKYCHIMLVLDEYSSQHVPTFRASLSIFFLFLGPPFAVSSLAVSKASSTSRTLSFFTCPHSQVSHERHLQKIKTYEVLSYYSTQSQPAPEKNHAAYR